MNPNTNPKTLTMLTLTLTDPQGAIESFRVPVFCDFVPNYSYIVDGPVYTSFLERLQHKITVRSSCRLRVVPLYHINDIYISS